MNRSTETQAAIPSGPPTPDKTQQNRPVQKTRDQRTEAAKAAMDKGKQHPAVGPARDNNVLVKASSSPKRENPAAGQKIPGISELPPSVQQALPGITISAHFYDNLPASRVVSINGRVMHEGQPVAAGLVLERITPEGIILNYQGSRFRMNIF